MKYEEDDVDLEPEDISGEALTQTPQKKLRSLTLRHSKAKAKGRKRRTN